MFDDLLIFAAVVEQQSLNRASRLLSLSQPALSRKIQNLERELGVDLFARRGKRLELTAAGHSAYAHALQLRKLEKSFRQAVGRPAAPRPSITIGASLTTLQSTLPDLISLFTETAPELEIKALTGKTHEIVSFVKDRKVDLGLLASKIDDPVLKCLPLFDDHLCLVLPEGHPLAGSASPGILDLSGLPMILFSKGTWYRVLMDELLQGYGVAPEIRMEIDSFEAILRLVPTCGVATLLPRSYLRREWIQNGGLVIRDLPELLRVTRTTSLVYVDATLLPDAAEQVVRLAQRRYAADSKKNA